jgi:two-component system response regulator NreC
MKRIRILLADDHELVRKGIISLLANSPEFEFVGEAADGAEAVRKTEELHPDVVVIDLSMPRVSGTEATRSICRRFPDINVLILTMHESDEYLYQILKSGAKGYVLKSSGREELSLAIRTVARGQRYFSRQVSDRLVEDFLRGTQERSATRPETEYALTRREAEILALIGEGLNSQQIAEQLFISHRTVDTHRTNIMQKLNIHDTAKLVRFAIEKGFVRRSTSP